MATLLRGDEPGTEHHVIQTSVAEAAIFRAPAAREFYLARLQRVAADEGALVRAYAIMDTHAHLLVWIARSLADLMSRVATGFASYFNRVNDRRGHVFGDEYWNKPILSEPQFLLTARYIYLNPMAGGILRNEEQLIVSPRTNYGALFGRPHPFPFDASATLARFGVPASSGRDVLRDMMSRGNEDFDPRRFDPYDPNTSDAIWSVEAARSHEARHAANESDARIRARVSAGWNIDAVIELVCSRLSVTPAELQTTRRTQTLSRARAAIAHLARTELDMPWTEIGCALGVTKQAAAVAAPNGKVTCEIAGLTLSIDGPPRG